jgi:hypothetical protein
LHLISWLFNCSYKVKLIIPNVATKIKLIIANVATNIPPNKNIKTRSNPPQPTHRKGLHEPDQRPPTQPPKPKPQRNGSQCKKPKKRPTQCKKIATPKKLFYFLYGGYPQGGVDAEVGWFLLIEFLVESVENILYIWGIKIMIC